ncbi:MAG: cadherin-like domain-containing protein [Salinibacter sp.]
MTLDLSTPDSGDLSTERTYDLTVTTTDSAGNSSSTTGTDRLTIDNTAPSVTSVSAPPDSAYGIGTVLSFDATYDETVVVDTSSGTPALALDVDGTIVDAAYRSGSGTDVLTFEYTVQQGDSMLAVADSSIQLNGGIIADRAENDAGLDFSGSGPDLSGVTIDGVRPTITNLSLSNDGNDNLALRFDAEEQLGDAPTDVAVTVDGPTTTDVYRFDRTDFAATDNGDGTYTYDLTTTQPYNAGDGPYTAAVDDALDPAGNDGADGSQTDSYTLDTTAPADLSVDTPTSPAFRASTTANGVQDTLSVGYSYTEEDADTDSAVVQLASTPDTALYRFVDDAYAGDNTTRTRLLDLTAPDATVNSGLVDGQTYNIVVVAINSDGRTARTSRADLLTIDNTANAPTAVSATAVAGGDIEVAFDGIDDGGSGTDFYAVQRKQEGEDASAYAAVDTVSDDGSASYTVTDSTTTDGTTYDYAVTTTDAVGNASDRSTTATATADATPPTVQRFTADTPSGQTVAVTLETDEPLGGGDSLRVDLSGPETATLSGGDFTESAGSGSFTYEATYPGSSDGTYTATLTTARDTAGNDGAGGATAETVVDTSPPATLSLDGPASTVTRASDGTASGVEDTLAVTYSYSDLSPDTTTIRIENGSNSVAFGVDDDAYAADGSLRTVRLDLSEKGPLPDTAYDIRVAAADTVGQSSTTEQTGLLEIDDAAPSIGALSLTNDGANNLAFQFESPEPLASITATVDGPSSGTDLYVFDESDFSASGTGSYTYTLSATQAYDDGGGVYVARVDAAVDEVGNDGATTADSAAYELPTARDTTLATDEDTRISAGAPGVLGNDRPAASQLAVATVDGTDSLGTQRQLDSGALLTLSSDGSYDYNPNGAFEALDTGESGTDAFTYTAAGPEGGTSSPATVTLDIAGVNDTAVVETNASLVLPVPGTSQTITTSTLSASDPDDDATGLTFTVTAAPSNGTLRNTATSTTLGSGDTFTQADLENGHIAYRHDGSSTTSDEFTFELADDNGAGATGRTFNIFIDIDNQSPTATNDDTTTTENDVLTADQTSEGVLANDDDPNGDRLTVSSVGGSADNVGNPVSLSSGGTVTINTDGTYSFDPGGAYEDLAGGESASPSVTYTAADGKGGSDGSALTVTVTGVNDAPTLPTNDGLVVQAGESGTITASILSAADPDDDATGLTFTVTAAPANGTLRNTATSTTLGSGDTFTQADLENGHIAYRHDGSSTTSDEFTFDLIDDDGAGPTGQSFPITIQEGTPVAQADSFAATEDQTLSISDPASGVLANDSDPEGDDLTASLFRTPQHGSLSFSGDGTFEYTPDPDYNGADRFVYVAADPSGNRDTATVQLNVAPVNDPPTIAGDRAFSVSEGGTYVLTGGDLDGRDADDSPSDLTYSVGTAPSNGQILLNGSQTGTFTQADVGAGNVSYRHDGTDTRSDSVELTLSDGTATTSPTDVSVTVSTQNNAPTIATSSLSLDEGASATITRSLLEATDQESEPSGLTYSVTSGPSNGTILLNGSPTSSFTQADVNDGDLSYRHDGSETTADSVDVTVSDENGASASGTFSITVNPVNDAPRVATNEGIAVSEGGWTTITTASLDAADADDGPSALTFTVTSGPAHGRILVGGGRAASFTQADLENGRVAYRHDGSDTSSDDFAFDLTDDDGAGPAGQSFPITIQEGTPAARADTFAATENQTLSISDPANGVLANDRDPQEEDLTASLTQTPDDGDLRLDADGTFEYAPDAGYNGADRFAYAAEDPSGNRDTAAVQLNVKKVNAPPVATDDRYLTEEGQTLSVTDSTGGVLANDRDPDEEDRLAVAVTDSTDNGTIRLDATAGTFEYAPSGGFSGEDAFQYEVRDGEGGTDRATASLQVRPDQSRVTVERSFSNPTRQRSFRLVALPGGEGPPLASTLSGRRGDDWRAFREAGATDTSSFARTRCGAGTECTLGGGTGYWLITRNAWSVEDSVETVALRRDSTTSMPVYRIPLQDGWNAISNPLETDVPWSAVQAASGTDRALYRWDGRWRRASTFTSAAEGVAYYFRDDQLDTLAVPYPSPQPPASQAKTRAGAPTLTLHAVQDGDTLSTVRAGRRRGTAVGLDSLDRYGPPGYFGGASLRFRADGEDRRPALRADYRPPGPQGRAFDLRLRAAPDTVLTLVARSAAAFPGERVVLVNRAHGRTHDLRADASVSLAPQSETTRFRLLIGSAAFVEDAREALAPDETTLMPSYPNPFRRATTIEYALKERQEVRLAIYDVLGRRVQVLVDGPRRAGFHRLQWQGEGPDGRPVASGVYFARLVAGSTTQTERLVVVR